MKNNFGFKVSINDELSTNAGLENSNFGISCTLNSFRRKIAPLEGLNINVGGYIPETNQYVKWIDTPLQLGNKITIEITNCNFDEPISISEVKSEEEILKGKLRAYYKLKEELKDYIKE